MCLQKLLAASRDELDIRGDIYQFYTPTSNMLGEGSFGCVSIYTCNQTSEQVAVKTIKKSKVDTEELYD
jgi:hypothetical protein